MDSEFSPISIYLLVVIIFNDNNIIYDILSVLLINLNTEKTAQEMAFGETRFIEVSI